MNKLTRLLILPYLALLAGCGATSLGLSGGSIPTGRAITGTAVLPSDQPLASGAVTVTTLATQAQVGSSTTDAAGRFQLTEIPSGSDLVISVKRQGGTTILKVVVPISTLAQNP